MLVRSAVCRKLRTCTQILGIPSCWQGTDVNSNEFSSSLQNRTVVIVLTFVCKFDSRYLVYYITILLYYCSYCSP